MLEYNLNTVRRDCCHICTMSLEGNGRELSNHVVGIAGVQNFLTLGSSTVPS